MIYSVLEFGQFFVMKEDEKCRNLLIALTPAVRVVFIITQLQFIFNTDKQLTIKNFKSLARFGLMHMMATNVCVWFNVLVQESKYEILKYHDIGEATRGLLVEDLYECRHDNIMGSLVQDASPFLFPCTIEYSLICAVILYTMWKDACSKRGGNGGGGAYGNQVARAKPTKASAAHHVRVDCASAHKGLFAGVLVLVLTIISLVMFFVLVEQPGLQRLAVLEVNLATLALYGLSVLATGLCAYRIKELRYDNNRCFELDNTLLVVAQWGLYASNISSMLAVSLGDHARPDVLVKSVASTAQATLQTVFIVDAWWRICTTPSQMRRRPGRQLVTFLLVTNLALWLVSRTQTARPEFQPVEVRFYGVRAWTIISHVTMPLAIFYRFHSTVCLCEIWKCCYKMKLVSAR
ncbi:proton channel OtopLc-like [Bacillus rossius redtenbacheri]|uniref:proton channel OtopLc-like n=1 Tax=Bacillus rossius redtenbacheri TaxID=93214 RepID=UPI002FDF08BE